MYRLQIVICKPDYRCFSLFWWVVIGVPIFLDGHHDGDIWPLQKGRGDWCHASSCQSNNPILIAAGDYYNNDILTLKLIKEHKGHAIKAHTGILLGIPKYTMAQMLIVLWL